VGIGGFLGSILRYLCSTYSSFDPNINLISKSTLFVNVLGSFAAGVVLSIISRYSLQLHPHYFFVMIGILGGFTTYSAYSVEVIQLIQVGRLYSASIYVVLTTTLSLLAAFIGYKIF
jgi:CrcB protein